MITNLAASAACAYYTPSSTPKEIQNTFANVLQSSNTNALSAAKIGPIADSLINMFKAQLQAYGLNKYIASKYGAAARLSAIYSGPNYIKRSTDEWFAYLDTPEGKPFLAEGLKAFWGQPPIFRMKQFRTYFTILTRKGGPTGSFAMGGNAFNDILNRLAKAPLHIRQEVKDWFPTIFNLAT
jgi:hypothetical protein